MTQTKSPASSAPQAGKFTRLKNWLSQPQTRILGRDVALAIAGSVAVALPYPNVQLWPLAWAGLAAILWACWERPLKQVFWLGLLAGGLTNVIGFFWMDYLLVTFGHLPEIPSFLLVVVGGTWQGVSVALSLVASLYISRRTRVSIIWALPLCYTALEYVHPILFPWYLGNSQYNLLWLTQVCDLVGVSGVTFLVVQGNVALLLLARRLIRHEPMPAQALGFPVLLALVLGYGAIRLNQVESQQSESPSLKVAVMEPEIGIFEEQKNSFPPGENPIEILRWNLFRQQADTAKLLKTPSDLVLWPESSYFPVISLLAHRAEPDVWAFSGRQVVGIDVDGPARLPLEFPQTVNASVSSGEERTWFAGDQGGLWTIEDGVPAAIDSPTQEGLTAGALHCTSEDGMEETAFQDCQAFFVGRKGAAVKVEDGQASLIATGTNRDLLSVAALAPDLLVAGGEEVALLLNAATGSATKLELPAKRWLYALKLGDRAVLVSSDGTVADVGSDGSAVSKRSEELRRHDVVGVASPDGESLLIATSTGLFLTDQSGSQWIAKDLQLEALSCDQTGECAVLTGNGAVRFWKAGELRSPVPLPHAGPWQLASVPFTRYLWWIPEDARRLYQSPVPLPADGPYPAPVLADLQTPVRDINAPQRGFKAPMLFGAIAGRLQNADDPHSLENVRLNSAFLVDELGRVLGRYDKQYLLAFGEYLPGGTLFPELYDLIPESGRFSQGPNQGILQFKGHRLGVLICYEDLLTTHTRGVVAQGAEVLLNLTNDAWFGKTKEPDQHFVLAAFRAIEYRKALVRSTCTGISGVVLPSGRIVQRTGLHGAEQFVQAVPLMAEATLFARAGYLFPFVLLLAGIGLVLAAWRRRV